MSEVGQKERRTQQRLAKLFVDELDYQHLGDWQDRDGNSNVEPELLRAWLTKQGHSEYVVDRTLAAVEKAKTVAPPTSLYDANRSIYTLLRYGVQVAPEVGEHKETVWLIDWENPDNNDFAIAEEVTVFGEHTKRPDIVVYVNGIALAVIELKRSIVSVAEGIRQSLDSQKKEFIEPFFATVQLIFAGNDTEGLRYGVIQTREKYFMEWKEEGGSDNPLDRGITQLCTKERFLEILHDFMVFDAGTKKTCRHNQYFGVRAAQAFVKRRDGGIIWHTQGSGKSLTMVWLAKWIRENITDSRVLIVTDRTELDEQIEKVFKGVDEDIYRTTSGTDLVSVLNRKDEDLVCSLVQKFGSSGEGSVDAFIEDLEKHLPKDFKPKGQIYVFVDECHRSHTDKLHKAMKRILPDATFIGFTGTPLLKGDKQRSIEIFGPYIHTYKYDEAVRDGVVLDLRYEARDIDQELTSPQKVDQYFEAKTRGLSDHAKAQVKKRWGTMQQLYSAEDRLQKIVGDIVLDMATRDRLMSDHGNAILVAGSIYQACRFYEMFEKTDLRGKCAIITSYRPGTSDIKGEESGEGETEAVERYKTYRKMLADHFGESEDAAMAKVEQFEKDIKKRFIEQPGQMKLLIVVDKLLTGFDAPPATYLYIDKVMRDHALFQAICRVNRLDTEDKEYGYIVDYKDLFKSLEKSVLDYTGEAFEGYDREDVAGLLKDRLEQGRQRLEEVLEEVRALCEPVEPPRDTQAYLRYFVSADTVDADQLADNEPKRVALYKLVAALVRAYAAIANEMPEAGYSNSETDAVKKEVDHFEKAREEVKLASGDYVDMKMFEPAMRHLLDTYIRADESEPVSAFDDLTLVELIVERGESAIDELPESLRKNREAMAETIENNVRRVIIDESPVNPKYYDKMSELLDALIEQRKREATDYKEYLERLVEVAKKVKQPGADASYPAEITSAPQRALYDNLGQDAPLALRLDEAIRKTKRDDWRGNKFKEKEVRIAIEEALDSGTNGASVEEIYEIVRAQREY
jgi:type I restriction enzyme, R subunit